MSEEECLESIEEWEHTISALEGTISQCKVKLNARRRQLRKVCKHVFHRIPADPATYIPESISAAKFGKLPIMTVCKKCGKVK